MKNHKRPLSGKGAFMVLGCAFMLLWGGYSFGLFEGGWF